jgi:hypothetical protein
MLGHRLEAEGTGTKRTGLASVGVKLQQWAGGRLVRSAFTVTAATLAYR